MTKYSVNLRDGTKDHQFRDVEDLLRSEGYPSDDQRLSARVQQPDGSFKEQGLWYLFGDRAKASEFADKLRTKSKNPSWEIFEVDLASIENLIEQHRQFRDEPLVLAMYYDAGDNPNEIYLLEVIENFGANSINPDRELFEVSFTKESPVDGEPDQTWHLVLTNPPEFDAALREKWDHAEKIRRAVGAGRYEILFMTGDEGVRNRDLIHA